VLTNGSAMAGLFATALHVGSFFTTVQLATTWLDRTGRLPKDQQMPLWIGLGLLSVLGSSLLGRTADALGKRFFVMGTSVLLAMGFWLLAREPDNLTLALVGSVLALVASARTGPLQALVSGQVPAGDLAALMGLRGFLMQVGVGGFALAAAALERERSFAAVLWLAVGFQALSYLAIRLFVREGK
jgi:predicted MFS family arabinose efflux permease